LKSAIIRDRLSKKFKIKAIEMEASGIAEATWENGRGYFVVRGICDFANDDKNKVWQPYAAAAAAAFTRDLIESMPLMEESKKDH
jgi:nucleoside phosphorylase